MSRPSQLEGWISNDESQSKFLDCWKMRKLTTHKFLKLSFFRSEGFLFQNWLKRQGVRKFVEMADPWYRELVKVFYYNLWISEGTLCSRVQGVDIKLIDDIWTNIAGLKLGGERCHLGMEGFHKFSVYQDSLRNPEEVRDYSHYKTGGMKKDDRLAVFVISRILMPIGSNHAQDTTEDLYLLKAFKENIQVNWPTTISDNMLKVTRLESAMLPYCVFISKVLIHLGVDSIGESSESYSRTSLINKFVLHKMGMQHTPNGWLFKNEVAEEDEEARGSSSIQGSV
ncbi:hypothetical protein LR48_Vigan11g099400 [Vigna angularis]|uniref:Putative plant transposon protein domain-containing protein n=1 Tax=Phaseolus angularis TaxID=3914 RepID=A0A0L9VSC6_PHAAN|nr:hypothetical protein LR48_Vigan11g099400 [Vigna angularis]